MRLAMEAAIEAACSFASVALRPSGIPPYLVRVRGRVGVRLGFGFGLGLGLWLEPGLWLGLGLGLGLALALTNASAGAARSGSVARSRGRYGRRGDTVCWRRRGGACLHRRTARLDNTRRGCPCASARGSHLGP